MAGGKLSAKKIGLAQRRYQVLALRRAGADFREIAETLVAAIGTPQEVPEVTPKYDFTAAYQDAMVEMQRLAAERKDLAVYERDLQLEQLRELWAKFAPMAIERGDYLAFDRCLAIQKRRAMLMDVEPSERHALSVDFGKMTNEQLQDYIARQLAALGGSGDGSETAGDEPAVDGPSVG